MLICGASTLAPQSAPWTFMSRSYVRSWKKSHQTHRTFAQSTAWDTSSSLRQDSLALSTPIQKNPPLTFRQNRRAIDENRRLHNFAPFIRPSAGHPTSRAFRDVGCRGRLHFRNLTLTFFITSSRCAPSQTSNPPNATISS